MSTTTITITSIAIATNNMICYLFLFSLEHFVGAGSNISILKDYQILAEKT